MITFELTEKTLKLEEIKAFEQQFDIVLPESYTGHILQYNGGMPTADYFKGVWIDSFYPIKYGGEYSLEETLYRIIDILPFGFYPFAYDHGGNQIGFFLTEEKYGHIYIWYHDMEEDDELDHLTDSFEEFMSKLAKEPYDF